MRKAIGDKRSVLLNFMNVYDFDGTIYNGDSTRDFVLYMLIHYPKVIKYMPTFFIATLKYVFGAISKTKMKETLYRFLNSFKMGEIDRIVVEFWSKNKKNIYDWYYEKKNKTDVIVSASPRFILQYICDELGVNLICSEVNKTNGDYIGLNCYGEEKVSRFFKEYPNATINEFYSDSKSDTPLAKKAKTAFIVKPGGIITKWN